MRVLWNCRNNTIFSSHPSVVGNRIMCGNIKFEFVTYVCEYYAFLKWEVVPYSAQYCSNGNCLIIQFTEEVQYLNL